jgi:hypothetical protein
MLVTVLILIVVVLVAVAAVPLMLRLIPRNPVFGVPTERTLADEKTWFRVNAFAGKAVLAACGLAAHSSSSVPGHVADARRGRSFSPSCCRWPPRRCRASSTSAAH